MAPKITGSQKVQGVGGSPMRLDTYLKATTHPYNPNYLGGRTNKSKFVPPKGNLKGYKKGGKVTKTGPAKLHKGERVLTKKQTKKYDEEKFKKKFNKARMAFAKGN